MAGITTSRALVYRDGAMIISTTLLLLVFLIDLHLYWWEGVILLVILVAYIGYLIYNRAESEEHLTPEPFRWTDVPLFLVGITTVVASGHFFVESASHVATFYGVTEWVIGVTIVAFGTSAPEIATSGIALWRGQSGMSAGNLIGSALFNLLGVLGVAAVLAPGGDMMVDQGAQESTYALVIMVAIVVWMMRSDWKISRVEGGILLAIGIARWTMDFMGISIVTLITGG